MENKAKAKAIARVHGNWENSYKLLPRWLAVVSHFVPGTIVRWAGVRDKFNPSDGSLHYYRTVLDSMCRNEDARNSRDNDEGVLPMPFTF
ncbi:uncharacterized protein G2W53_037005 [Senna tora]|uniref:Uncharacterized protein n=1 Tax=Senna tora TaxID=362788 RepID=A0A834W5N5_9FABA|nr:uncharacterized protein G2W53_037005 [Senna tora]